MIGKAILRGSVFVTHDDQTSTDIAGIARRLNVRFGSFADITAMRVMSGLPPDSGHSPDELACPFSRGHQAVALIAHALAFRGIDPSSRRGRLLRSCAFRRSRASGSRLAQ